MANSQQPPAPPSRRWVVARRTAVALWFVFGFVVWNVIFDATVAQGARKYLTAKVLHEQGNGPGASIHGVMDEAVARGARTATAIGGGVFAAGLALIWVASRRRVVPAEPSDPSARGGE